MAEGTITDVAGVAVGHRTLAAGRTGVTVITFPVPNRAVADVRGGAPGTRELGLLGDAARGVPVDAVVFAGGSAFGLAAADGVVAALAAEGRGVPTPAGPVPIVPAAIVFDLATGEAARPGPDDGAAAYRARSREAVPLGAVGAGTGATVGNWRGPAAVRSGGVGSAALRVGEATVGALVVVNAAGDVFTLEGASLSGGAPAALAPFGGERAAGNTTLVCVATDGTVADRNELRRAAIRAHDAIGACIRPAHTRYDGDTVLVVSCGTRDLDPDLLQQAAFLVVGRAIERALRAGEEVG